MLNWLRREAKIPGWLAASVGPDGLDFAHGRAVSAGKPMVGAYGSHPVGDDRDRLQKLAGELQLDHYRCSTLLRAGEYQLLQVEAPNVPQAELRSAIRWRVKDLIDFHLDDATLDVLDIPPDAAPGAARSHLMYAVAARNEIIQGRIREFQDARIPLQVIEIPETAQRNIAALCEADGRGIALLYLARDWGLLTINFRSELYLARRLEIGLGQLTAGAESGAERLALEIQRTLDHFERQFRQVAVARLLLAPMPAGEGLQAFLQGRLGIPVQALDLREAVTFEGPAPDVETQWRLFHLFGAALRHETKAL